MTGTDAPFEVGLLLFPELTILDLLGPYQVFSRTPGFRVHVIAKSRDPVPDQHGLCVLPTTDFAGAPDLDLLCVPGGFGDIGVIEDAVSMAFIRDVGGRVPWLTSVCTGSLILAAAGLLTGKRAACHWSSREVLSIYGAIPDAGRVVEDGQVITGGGVTAGLDFALHVVALLKGEPVAQSVQLSLEYAPSPPFDAGRPETAPDAVRERVESVTREAVDKRLAKAREVMARQQTE